MNYYFKESSYNTKKNINNSERLSTYMPPRIVLSSHISRRDLNNPDETDAQEYKKRDDVDELFQNLREQMQDKLKECRENKDKLKLSKSFNRKSNNFVGEFLQAKKRFEADFTANTQIYQNTSQSLKNNETIRDINNEEWKLQRSSVDKYMAMLQSQKTAQSSNLSKAVNKYYSLQTQNWVPGAVITKIKTDSDSDPSCSGGSIKNQEQIQNSIINNRGNKIRDKVKNELLYGFTYKSGQDLKRTKSKKKSFIEEFCELKDKLGVIPKSKITNQEEDIEILNEENEKEEALSIKLTQKQGIEKVNNKIVTPFACIKTSFFSDYNSAQIPKSNWRKRGNAKEDITADWVKGDSIQRDSIQRDEKMTKNFMYSRHKSEVEDPELDFISGNKYSRISPSFTPVNDTLKSKNNKQFVENNNYCSSAITMSTIQYSKNINIHRPSLVITETKVTNLMFPLHQKKWFQ